MLNMLHRFRRQVLVLLTMFLAPGVVRAQALQTHLAPDDFDPDATAVWVEGETQHDVTFDANRPDRNLPPWVFWTASTQPGHSGWRFGETSDPGPRHLRIGFTEPTGIGTVIVRGNVTLSVLKTDAAYPGDLGNDDHWQPAKRLREAEIGVWVLPPNTRTRALRFTADEAPHPTAVNYAGHIAGVYVLPERYVNIAPAAAVITSHSMDEAARVVNGRQESWWDPWDTGRSGAEYPVSPEHPQWVMLYWPQPVDVAGVATLWAGFGDAEVQVYSGPDDRHPREAPPAHWRTLDRRTFKHYYPTGLPIVSVGFDQPATTRAVRIRMLGPAAEYSHVRGKTADGNRVWLGELLALHAIGHEPAETVKLPGDELALHPPIPIHFTLKRDAHVTLAIDDADGKRVRNLITAQPFKAGEHTVWWDGLDESGRVKEQYHGIYQVQGKLVEPGEYRVRGLMRDPVELGYEFTVYNAGSPPWLTGDQTGGWLADHSPPIDTLYVPGDEPGDPGRLLISAHVAEAGHGLIAVDLEGRKQWGVRWIGGHWTGATHLARDAGDDAIAEHYAYTGAGWRVDTDRSKGEVRLMALTEQGAETVVKHRVDSRKLADIGGLAVHNGLIAASLPNAGTLLLVDARTKAVVGEHELADARGLAFDGDGRLLAAVGERLLGMTVTREGGRIALGEAEVLTDDLVEPQRLALDEEANIYVSEAGDRHQVRVLDAEGRPIRRIGKAGGPQLGRYDEQRMHNPRGITVTPDGRVWVAEHDPAPKRVSVWTRDGEFVRGFYGPSKYGGGGNIDPQDRSRFYYVRGMSGMEFHIDWATGDWRLHRVYYRAGGDRLTLGGRQGGVAPQQPIYHDGRQYMTNVFNMSPTGGATIAGLWMMDDDVARPVAAIGSPAAWNIFDREDLKDLVDEKAGRRKQLFAWSDLNGDAAVQREEVSVATLAAGTVIINRDLSAITTYTTVLEPRGFTDAGAPIYHVDDASRRVEELHTHWTSGGSETMPVGDHTVVTGGPMRGFRDGRLAWTYPNQWPSLHGGHKAPPTQYRGQMIATTRLLGYPVNPPEGEAGPMWAINGDRGNAYLMTGDGLFVDELGRDGSVAPQWRMPEERRGMPLTEISMIGEHFWPTINQTADGKVYLVAGKNHASIVRVDGLRSIERFEPWTVTVTPELLAEADAYQRRREAAKVEREGRNTLVVDLREEAPTVDGELDDWSNADWAKIDEQASAAAAVADGRLYAAFRTGERNLLRNTAESLPMLFKTGGALDVKLATNPEANPDRQNPAVGDLRLLVTRAKDETVAVLYQPVAADADPVPFSSPWRTVTFDRVADVSEHVKLAAGDGGYELSVPLDVLGLDPGPGMVTLGDAGLLRGQAGFTRQRVYWHNKATGYTTDVPGEAMLQPHLWGRWRFE